MKPGSKSKVEEHLMFSEKFLGRGFISSYSLMYVNVTEGFEKEMEIDANRGGGGEGGGGNSCTPYKDF
jgi:hypothetical protein